MNTDLKTILASLASGEITQEQAESLISLCGLSAKKAKAPQGIHFATTPKGCVGVRGLGRAQWGGIIAYPKEWLAILEKAEELRKFIKDNENNLSFEKGILGTGDNRRQVPKAKGEEPPPQEQESPTIQVDCTPNVEQQQLAA